MTKTMRRAAPAVLGLLALAAAPAAAQEGPQRFGDLAVTVTVPAGATLKKATVYARSATAAVSAAGTAVTVAKVPAGKLAVTVDAEVLQGKATRRHLGVVEATALENEVVAVAVPVEPAPVIDDYCLGCHPNPRDPKVKPKPNQIVRDIHTSGLQFPDKSYEQSLAQNKRHNDLVAQLEREGKPHNLPMPLEARKVKVGGREVERFFYTCETCHTLHASTPWSNYVRAPFKDRSDLCMGCHS
jgi:predicted CXXCH cytochrome family protein